MAIQLGNTNIGSIYLGSAKISEAYLGSTKIYSSAPAVQYPYLMFQCDGYYGHPSVSSIWNGQYEWIQVSSSPNVWKLEITKWGYAVNFGTGGLMFMFSSNDSQPVGTITHSCSLIGSGNMDVTLDGHYCESMDRMFGGCTGLEYIEPIHCTVVQNVGGMFSGCTYVEEGALAQYNWFNTYGVNITNHSGTFTNCGSSTTTGAAELAQIPVGWGGTMIPASTLMTSSRAKWKSNYDEWSINANGPDWTSMNGVYIFTEASVSTYAGVSMSRSRIAKFNGLVTTQGSVPLYFYPCFMQHTTTAITWAVTTGSPNGSLTVSQGANDMPGTLDYSTYGPFEYEFGTYDSAETVYFCFLVTSFPIVPFFDLSTDPYGVLYNSNFKANAGLRWFR